MTKMFEKLAAVKPGDAVTRASGVRRAHARCVWRADGQAHRPSPQAVRRLSCTQPRRQARKRAGTRESASFIDASAPVSSSRERPSRSACSLRSTAPKSTPGTQPMRAFLIRYSAIAHDSDSPVMPASLAHCGVDLHERVERAVGRVAGKHARRGFLQALVEHVAAEQQFLLEVLDALLRAFHRADGAVLRDRRDVARGVEHDLESRASRSACPSSRNSRRARR